MIHFTCPKCKSTNRVEDGMAGEETMCSDCGSTILVPTSNRRAGIEDEGVHAFQDEEPIPAPKKSKPVRASLDEEEPDEAKPKTKKRKKRKEKVEDEGDSGGEAYSSDGSEGSYLLGRCKQVFKPAVATWRILAIICTVLSLAGVLCCFLSMVASMPSGTMAFALVAMPLGLAGVLLCMNFLMFKVAVHVAGIVHSHRGQSRIIPWTEIESVTEAITEINTGEDQVTIYNYTLILTDSTRIEYTNNRIGDIVHLGRILIENTKGLILPKVEEQFERGKVFNFGLLGLSREGLHYKKKILPWEEVEAARISEGYISIKTDGKWQRWCNIPAASVPNAYVFVAFVEKHKG